MKPRDLPFWTATLVLLAAFAPRAHAQVCLPLLPCPDNTPPSVSISAPANGATVSGIVVVKASASDNRGVAGVQFRLDGADHGAEDTAAPYEVAWDTSSVPNGSHTLTAVARDAAGNGATSTPVTVTVANGVPQAIRRYEESDPSVSFGVGWGASQGGWFAWSGGAAAQTNLPGARATFTFDGTAATWIGYRSGRSGIARVYLDGVQLADVDLFARTDEPRAPILSVKGLAPGSHTLVIEATGLKNAEAAQNHIQVDAFDVPAPAVSHLQETDPEVSYAGTWEQETSGIAWSAGDAKVSEAAGARATLSFRGTSAAWRGYRGPDAGIARVYVDGAFAAEVDLYAPTHFVQDAVYAAGGLADGAHTLTVEATGLRHPSASAARVIVDAFDVTAPGVRSQETDAAVSYSGSWVQGNRNRTWSEGTAAVSNTPGSRASFSFSGTEVRWVGLRAARTGIANVYLDGMFIAEVDTYAAGAEGYQATAYALSGLAPGEHTLAIEATGRRNPAATNNYVVVDAFDVVP
ncbi:MAG TPA: Ig-like domain-containing protein [Burkholderiales bacterium]|nr:Ig-like domain-containing protein [Burkholderiales bacterium]